MIPSIISRPPSPAAPSSPDRTKSPHPPVPSTAQVTTPNTAAAARPATSGAATAAQLRALIPLVVPESQVGHKRHSSTEVAELAQQSGRNSQAPRSAGLEPTSDTILKNTASATKLRHAVSTSALSKSKDRNSSISTAAGDLAPAGSERKKVAETFEQASFLRGEEKPGYIRMKKTEAGPGAIDVLYRLAATNLARFPDARYNTDMKLHSTLIRQPDGTCLLEDAKTGIAAPPVDGKKYIFVTMPDNIIRVSEQGTKSNGHAQVSGVAPYVRYAGEVIFEKGREARATRKSGTYRPPSDNARELSGLNCEFIDDFHAFDKKSTDQISEPPRHSP